MGMDKDKWCKYHKIRGHDIDSCIHLRREIERLIQNRKLRGYAQDRRDERQKADNKKEEVGAEKRHTLNTILGGFAGGGESSSARKKYVR
jgi:hypothetical protein